MVSSFPSENQVLEHFQCPFQGLTILLFWFHFSNTFFADHDDQTSTCSFHVHIKTLVRKKCPFGHSKPNQLRELPPYICFQYLAIGCSNAIITNNGGDSSSPSSQASSLRVGDQQNNNNNRTCDDLPRCIEGFHPPLEDLVDLEQLHQKMAFHILSGDTKQKLKAAKSPNDNSPSAEKENSEGESKTKEKENGKQAILHSDDQCCICLESVTEVPGRLFGLTERCSHVFCSDCLLTWSEGRVSVSNRNTHRCPTCRVETGKVVVCQRLPETADEKEKLFEQTYKCLSICRHSITPSLLSEDDDSDDEDDDYVPETDDDDERNVTIDFGDYRVRLITHLFNAISGLERDDHEEEAEAAETDRDEPMEQGEVRVDSVEGANAVDEDAPRNLEDESLISFPSPPSSNLSTSMFSNASSSDGPPPLEDGDEEDGDLHWEID